MRAILLIGKGKSSEWIKKVVALSSGQPQVTFNVLDYGQCKNLNAAQNL
jgi:hypothetical protein